MQAATTKVTVSRQTAQFLLGMLDSQQLSVGAPNFDQVVTAISKARRELRAGLPKETKTKEKNGRRTGPGNRRS